MVLEAAALFQQLWNTLFSSRCTRQVGNPDVGDFSGKDIGWFHWIVVSFEQRLLYLFDAQISLFKLICSKVQHQETAGHLGLVTCVSTFCSFAHVCSLSYFQITVDWRLYIDIDCFVVFEHVASDSISTGRHKILAIASRITLTFMNYGRQ